MRRSVPTILLTALVLTAALSAARVVGPGRKDAGGAPPLPRMIRTDEIPAPAPAKHAPTDSLYLYGGPASLEGKFQDAAGLPDRQGWTGIDLHEQTESNWQVSTFNAAALDPSTPDNHAWWCGAVFDSCNETDPAEGYGSSWIEFLDWRGAVADTASDATVRVRAVMSYDIEPGEDWLYLQVDNGEYMQTLETWSFSAEAETVDVTATVPKEWYVGEKGDEVHLRWSFDSDGAWDDSDCRWPTAGAAQIDLIRVDFDQGSGPVQIGATETCEPGDELQWAPHLIRGPGDFSKVWPELWGLDPDTQNLSPQFAFIDDGVVVPGTGGSPCDTWCYGDGGWVVNSTGGVADIFAFLDNRIHSPVIAVPDGAWNAAIFAFDQYVHSPIDQGAPYIFGMWQVRSTADPAGETGWSEWRDYNSLVYGDPRYVREIYNVTDLLVPGFRSVQLSLGVMHYYWYSSSNDATPAPYFDNVSLQVYENKGGSSLLVRADGSGDYPTIQSAILAAADGDTVLLADGVFTGEGNRDLYYYGKQVVVRSRSGDPTACVIDCEGAPGENHRAATFQYEEGPGATLEGVTITGGRQEGSSTYFYTYSGAGVWCKNNTSPLIADCIFRGNQAGSADQMGGAIFAMGAAPTIRNCVFENNTAEHGGAIAAEGLASVRVENCLFTGNGSTKYGGALVAWQDDAYFSVESCTFADNDYAAITGVMASYQNGRFDVDRSIIAFNTEGYACAATDTTDFTFTCTDIWGNTRADWYGYFADQVGTEGNLHSDPLFCREINPTVPYGIDEDSPCGPAVNPACGLIGYSPVACGDWSGADDLPAPAARTRLLPCSPNPFNPRTTVAFDLAAAGRVTVRIYGLDGSLVRTLVDETRAAGPHRAIWDGADDAGRPAASGVYLCRLVSGPVAESTRMVLLR